MLEGKFVSYEIALKLKELGFKELCICHYNSYKQLKNKIIGCFDGDYLKEDKYDDSLPAPLYEQAFDWFERFNMYSVIERTSIGSDEWEHSYSINYLPIEFKDYKRRGIHFKWIHSFREDGTCYEGAWRGKNEAREECLKRLIQIIENEK